MANVHKPFFVFKASGDFLCDDYTSAFRDDCHSSGTSFSADFPRIWACLVYPLAIRAPLN